MNMDKEKLAHFASFDPRTMAQQELQIVEMEGNDDMPGKFASEVKVNQMLYGISEAAAYKITVVHHEREADGLTDDAKRNALVKLYETIKEKTKLDFDPYEAAMADEKLGVAKKANDDKAVAKELAKLFGIVYSKPAADFQKACNQRVKSINAFCGTVALAFACSPSYLFGSTDVSAVRADFKRNWNSDGLEDQYTKYWELLKEAILK